MKKSTFYMLAFLSLSILLSGFSTPSSSVFDNTVLAGAWVRKNDKLVIEVSNQTKDLLHSFIIGEGVKKFPCQVAEIPIYKNIAPVKENLWTCDFLVVEMGSCITSYEQGRIKITKAGDMEITCPGFASKYYTRVASRYKASDNLTP